MVLLNSAHRGNRGTNEMIIEWQSAQKELEQDEQHVSAKAKPERPMLLSLFEISADYVVKHVENLQSLHGLPEFVGQALFHRFVEEKSLKRYQKIHGLTVFCDAYDQILCSLNLRNSNAFVNEFSDYLSVLMANVVELDLGHCKLGIGNDLLMKISDLKKLRRLCLRDNSISDDCWRKMTLRSRMYKDGIQQLTHLDLSDNMQLSSKALQFCLHFQQLDFLDLSQTSVEVSAAKIFCAKMKLECKTNAEYCTMWTQPTTCGWAKDFVDNLMDDHASTALSAYVCNQTNMTSFYRKLPCKRVKNDLEKVTVLPSKHCVVCIRVKNSCDQNSVNTLTDVHI